MGEEEQHSRTVMKLVPQCCLAAGLFIGGLFPISSVADRSNLVVDADIPFGVSGAFDAVSTPLQERQALFGLSREALALRWKHRLSGEHSFSFAAGYGDDPYLDDSAREGVGTMAALSWTSQWGSRWRPQVSGSLFTGDDTVRDEDYRTLERRYYGFALGGRLQLFERHSPFVSFRMLRGEEGGDLLEPDPLEYSRMTAGWDWQIRPNWRLRAEADYISSETGFNLYRYERTGIFFSTRFDFR